MGPPSLQEATASPPTPAIPPGFLPSTSQLGSHPLQVPPRQPRSGALRSAGPCFSREIRTDPITGCFSLCSLPCVSPRGVF